jgi:hypothetical protein
MGWWEGQEEREMNPPGAKNKTKLQTLARALTRPESHDLFLAMEPAFTLCGQKGTRCYTVRTFAGSTRHCSAVG